MQYQIGQSHRKSFDNKFRAVFNRKILCVLIRMANETDIREKAAFKKKEYMEMVCSADDRIIAALDVDSFEKMESIVEELGELVSFYKVGMEL